MAKRGLDLLGAICGLLLLAPLFLLVALAIKLDSPGPVFFRQERVGRHGRPFRIFKFRTMTVTPPGQGLQITASSDRRITRVGAFLRRSKIDELPQLIDVLRGTMSLVGPRPEVPRYVAEYPEDRRAQVLSVRPGITDFASLMFRDEGDRLARAADPEREYVEVILPEKLRVAANYVEHVSMAADLRAVGLTLRTIFVPAAAFERLGVLMRNRAFWSRIERWLSTPGRGSLAWAVIADSLIVLACWHLTYLFRLGFERWQPGRPPYDDLVSFGVVLAYLAALWLCGARRTLWRFFAFDDLRRIVVACALAGLSSAVVVLMLKLSGVARAVLVLHPVFALLGLAAARMLLRMLWEHAHACADEVPEQRRYAVVLGGGEPARRVIAGLHRRAGWQVILLLSDDPHLQGLRVAGVPVAGPLRRVRDPSLIAGATHAILALSDEPAAVRAQAEAWARDSGLVVMGIPDPEDFALKAVAAPAEPLRAAER